MEAKKITTVVFDMGQVLIHWTPFSVTDHLGLSEEDMSILLGEMFQSVEWVSLDHGTLTREQAVELCRLAQQDAADSSDTDVLDAMMSNDGKTADIDTGWDMYRYQVVIYGGGEKGQDEAHSLTMMSYCTRMQEFIDGLDLANSTADVPATEAAS